MGYHEKRYQCSMILCLIRGKFMKSSYQKTIIFLGLIIMSIIQPLYATTIYYPNTPAEITTSDYRMYVMSLRMAMERFEAHNMLGKLNKSEYFDGSGDIIYQGNNLIKFRIDDDIVTKVTYQFNYKNHLDVTQMQTISDIERQEIIDLVQLTLETNGNNKKQTAKEIVDDIIINYQKKLKNNDFLENIVIYSDYRHVGLIFELKGTKTSGLEVFTIN